MPKTCPICSKPLLDKDVFLSCNSCRTSFHASCVDYTPSDIEFMKDNSGTFTCAKCLTRSKLRSYSTASNTSEQFPSTVSPQDEPMSVRHFSQLMTKMSAMADSLASITVHQRDLSADIAEIKTTQSKLVDEICGCSALLGEQSTKLMEHRVKIDQHNDTIQLLETQHNALSTEVTSLGSEINSIQEMIHFNSSSDIVSSSEIIERVKRSHNMVIRGASDIDSSRFTEISKIIAHIDPGAEKQIVDMVRLGSAELISISTKKTPYDKTLKNIKIPSKSENLYISAENETGISALEQNNKKNLTIPAKMPLNISRIWSSTERSLSRPKRTFCILRCLLRRPLVRIEKLRQKYVPVSNILLNIKYSHPTLPTSPPLKIVKSQLFTSSYLPIKRQPLQTQHKLFIQPQVPLQSRFPLHVQQQFSSPVSHKFPILVPSQSLLPERPKYPLLSSFPASANTQFSSYSTPFKNPYFSGSPVASPSVSNFGSVPSHKINYVPSAKPLTLSVPERKHYPLPPPCPAHLNTQLSSSSTSSKNSYPSAYVPSGIPPPSGLLKRPKCPSSFHFPAPVNTQFSSSQNSYPTVVSPSSNNVRPSSSSSLPERPKYPLPPHSPTSVNIQFSPPSTSFQNSYPSPWSVVNPFLGNVPPDPSHNINSVAPAIPLPPINEVPQSPSIPKYLQTKPPKTSIHIVKTFKPTYPTERYSSTTRIPETLAPSTFSTINAPRILFSPPTTTEAVTSSFPNIPYTHPFSISSPKGDSSNSMLSGQEYAPSLPMSEIYTVPSNNATNPGSSFPSHLGYFPSPSTTTEIVPVIFPNIPHTKPSPIFPHKDDFSYPPFFGEKYPTAPEDTHSGSSYPSTAPAEEKIQFSSPNFPTIPELFTIPETQFSPPTTTENEVYHFPNNPGSKPSPSSPHEAESLISLFDGQEYHPPPPNSYFSETEHMQISINPCSNPSSFLPNNGCSQHFPIISPNTAVHSPTSFSTDGYSTLPPIPTVSSSMTFSHPQSPPIQGISTEPTRSPINLGSSAPSPPSITMPGQFPFSICSFSCAKLSSSQPTNPANTVFSSSNTNYPPPPPIPEIKKKRNSKTTTHEPPSILSQLTTSETLYQPFPIPPYSISTFSQPNEVSATIPLHPPPPIPKIYTPHYSESSVSILSTTTEPVPPNSEESTSPGLKYPLPPPIPELYSDLPKTTTYLVPSAAPFPTDIPSMYETTKQSRDIPNSKNSVPSSPATMDTFSVNSKESTTPGRYHLLPPPIPELSTAPPRTTTFFVPTGVSVLSSPESMKNVSLNSIEYISPGREYPLPPPIPELSTDPSRPTTLWVPSGPSFPTFTEIPTFYETAKPFEDIFNLEPSVPSSPGRDYHLPPPIPASLTVPSKTASNFATTFTTFPTVKWPPYLLTNTEPSRDTSKIRPSVPSSETTTETVPLNGERPSLTGLEYPLPPPIPELSTVPPRTTTYFVPTFPSFPTKKWNPSLLATTEPSRDTSKFVPPVLSSQTTTETDPLNGETPSSPGREYPLPPPIPELSNVSTLSGQEYSLPPPIPEVSTVPSRITTYSVPTYPTVKWTSSSLATTEPSRDTSNFGPQTLPTQTTTETVPLNGETPLSPGREYPLPPPIPELSTVPPRTTTYSVPTYPTVKWISASLATTEPSRDTSNFGPPLPLSPTTTETVPLNVERPSLTGKEYSLPPPIPELSPVTPRTTTYFVPTFPSLPTVEWTPSSFSATEPSRETSKFGPPILSSQSTTETFPLNGETSLSPGREYPLPPPIPEFSTVPSRTTTYFVPIIPSLPAVQLTPSSLTTTESSGETSKLGHPVPSSQTTTETVPLNGETPSSPGREYSLPPPIPEVSTVPPRITTYSVPPYPTVKWTPSSLPTTEPSRDTTNFEPPTPSTQTTTETVPLNGETPLSPGREYPLPPPIPELSPVPPRTTTYLVPTFPSSPAVEWTPPSFATTKPSRETSKFGPPILSSQTTTETVPLNGETPLSPGREYPLPPHIPELSTVPSKTTTYFVPTYPTVKLIPASLTTTEPSRDTSNFGPPILSSQTTTETLPLNGETPSSPGREYPLPPHIPESSTVPPRTTTHFVPTFPSFPAVKWTPSSFATTEPSRDTPKFGPPVPLSPTTTETYPLNGETPSSPGREYPLPPPIPEFSTVPSKTTTYFVPTFPSLPPVKWTQKTTETDPVNGKTPISPGREYPLPPPIPQSSTVPPRTTTYFIPIIPSLPAVQLTPSSLTTTESSGETSKLGHPVPSSQTTTETVPLNGETPSSPGREYSLPPPIPEVSTVPPRITTYSVPPYPTVKWTPSSLATTEPSRDTSNFEPPTPSTQTTTETVPLNGETPLSPGREYPLPPPIPELSPVPPRTTTYLVPTFPSSPAVEWTPPSFATTKPSRETSKFGPPILSSQTTTETVPLNGETPSSPGREYSLPPPIPEVSTEWTPSSLATTEPSRDTSNFEPPTPSTQTTTETVPLNGETPSSPGREYSLPPPIPEVSTVPPRITTYSVPPYPTEEWTPSSLATTEPSRDTSNFEPPTPSTQTTTETVPLNGETPLSPGREYPLPPPIPELSPVPPRTTTYLVPTFPSSPAVEWTPPSFATTKPSRETSKFGPPILSSQTTTETVPLNGETPLSPGREYPLPPHIPELSTVPPRTTTYFVPIFPSFPAVQLTPSSLTTTESSGDTSKLVDPVPSSQTTTETVPLNGETHLSPGREYPLPPPIPEVSTVPPKLQLILDTSNFEPPTPSTQTTTETVPLNGETPLSPGREYPLPPPIPELSPVPPRTTTYLVPTFPSSPAVEWTPLIRNHKTIKETSKFGPPILSSQTTTETVPLNGETPSSPGREYSLPPPIPEVSTVPPRITTYSVPPYPTEEWTPSSLATTEPSRDTSNFEPPTPSTQTTTETVPLNGETPSSPGREYSLPPPIPEVSTVPPRITTYSVPPYPTEEWTPSSLATTEPSRDTSNFEPPTPSTQTTTETVPLNGETPLSPGREYPLPPPIPELSPVPPRTTTYLVPTFPSSPAVEWTPLIRNHKTIKRNIKIRPSNSNLSPGREYPLPPPIPELSTVPSKTTTYFVPTYPTVKLIPASLTTTEPSRDTSNFGPPILSSQTTTETLPLNGETPSSPGREYPLPPHIPELSTVRPRTTTHFVPTFPSFPAVKWTPSSFATTEPSRDTPKFGPPVPLSPTTTETYQLNGETPSSPGREYPLPPPIPEFSTVPSKTTTYFVPTFPSLPPVKWTQTTTETDPVNGKTPISPGREYPLPPPIPQLSTVPPRTTTSFVPTFPAVQWTLSLLATTEPSSDTSKFRPLAPSAQTTTETVPFTAETPLSPGRDYLFPPPIPKLSTVPPRTTTYSVPTFPAVKWTPSLFVTTEASVDTSKLGRPVPPSETTTETVPLNGERPSLTGLEYPLPPPISEFSTVPPRTTTYFVPTFPSFPAVEWTSPSLTTTEPSRETSKFGLPILSSQTTTETVPLKSETPLSPGREYPLPQPIPKFSTVAPRTTTYFVPIFPSFPAVQLTPSSLTTTDSSGDTSKLAKLGDQVPSSQTTTETVPLDGETPLSPGREYPLPPPIPELSTAPPRTTTYSVPTYPTVKWIPVSLTTTEPSRDTSNFGPPILSSQTTTETVPLNSETPSSPGREYPLPPHIPELSTVSSRTTTHFVPTFPSLPPVKWTPSSLATKEPSRDTPKFGPPVPSSPTTTETVPLNGRAPTPPGREYPFAPPISELSTDPSRTTNYSVPSSPSFPSISENPALYENTKQFTDIFNSEPLVQSSPVTVSSNSEESSSPVRNYPVPPPIPDLSTLTPRTTTHSEPTFPSFPTVKWTPSLLSTTEPSRDTSKLGPSVPLSELTTDSFTLNSKIPTSPGREYLLPPGIPELADPPRTPTSFVPSAPSFPTINDTPTMHASTKPSGDTSYSGPAVSSSPTASEVVPSNTEKSTSSGQEYPLLPPLHESNSDPTENTTYLVPSPPSFPTVTKTSTLYETTKPSEDIFNLEPSLPSLPVTMATVSLNSGESTSPEQDYILPPPVPELSTVTPRTTTYFVPTVPSFPTVKWTPASPGATEPSADTFKLGPSVPSSQTITETVPLNGKTSTSPERKYSLPSPIPELTTEPTTTTPYFVPSAPSFATVTETSTLHASTKPSRNTSYIGHLVPSSPTSTEVVPPNSEESPRREYPLSPPIPELNSDHPTTTNHLLPPELSFPTVTETPTLQYSTKPSRGTYHLGTSVPSPSTTMETASSNSKESTSLGRDYLLPPPIPELSTLSPRTTTYFLPRVTSFTTVTWTPSLLETTEPSRDISKLEPSLPSSQTTTTTASLNDKTPTSPGREYPLPPPIPELSTDPPRTTTHFVPSTPSFPTVTETPTMHASTKPSRDSSYSGPSVPSSPPTTDTVPPNNEESTSPGREYPHSLAIPELTTVLPRTTPYFEASVPSLPTVSETPPLLASTEYSRPKTSDFVPPIFPQIPHISNITDTPLSTTMINEDSPSPIIPELSTLHATTITPSGAWLNPASTTIDSAPPLISKCSQMEPSTCLPDNSKLNSSYQNKKYPQPPPIQSGTATKCKPSKIPPNIADSSISPSLKKKYQPPPPIPKISKIPFESSHQSLVPPVSNIDSVRRLFQ
ncbi:hypothetical protein HHI36_015245 [Cryptolaemus montrouzieri]|uniref:PHD-type domain-containing protein n=1 Tax=Cryptolaemus montrouzieri TaxID=559131 RepID=A0ABD2N5H3_9CUCU